MTLNRHRILSSLLPPPALLALTLALAGCGGGGSSSSPSPTPAPPAVPQSVSAITPSGLTATLTEDRSTILVGGTVNFTLTLTNNTTGPVAFAVTSGNTGGTVTVKDAAGNTVFPVPTSGATNPALPGPGPIMTLQPGKSVVDAAAVSVFTATGTDNASAFFSIYGGSPITSQGVTVGPLPLAVQ